MGVLSKFPTRCQWAARVESHCSRVRPAPRPPDGETEDLEETGWASATNQLHDLNLPFLHPEMKKMNRPKPTLMYLSNPRAYDSNHLKGSNYKEVLVTLKVPFSGAAHSDCSFCCVSSWASVVSSLNWTRKGSNSSV